MNISNKNLYRLEFTEDVPSIYVMADNIIEAVKVGDVYSSVPEQLSALIKIEWISTEVYLDNTNLQIDQWDPLNA